MRRAIIKSILIGISVMLLCYWFLGFYYEDYEVLFTALLSGELTPGVIYSHLYYMAHLGGLSSFYASLYQKYPAVPWLNIIEYLYLLIALVVILYSFLRKTGKSYQCWFLFLLVVLFLEEIMMLNMTRVSSMLCLSSLVILYDVLISKAPSVNYPKLLLGYGLWCLGLYTRAETAAFFLVIAGLLFYISADPSLGNITYKKAVAILLLPVLMTISVLSFISVQLADSKEFYLQIEPDLEYELMVKGNFVTADHMHSVRDSLRYNAIKNGIWGDAAVNDAAFISSLVDQEHKGVLHWRGTGYYLNMWRYFISDYSAYLLVYACVSTLLLFYLLSGMGIRLLKLILFQLSLLIFVYAVAVQLKYADRVAVPLLLGCIITQVLLLLNFLKEKPRTGGRFWDMAGFVVLPASMVLIHTLDLGQKKSQDIIKYTASFKKIAEVARDKTLFLSGEALPLFFMHNRPFERLSLEGFRSVYIHHSLAFNTIRPYKDYLEQQFGGDAQDYGSLYKAFAGLGQDEAVYLISEKNEEILRKYLEQFHSLRISWEPIDSTCFFVRPDDIMSVDANNIRFYSARLIH